MFRHLTAAARSGQESSLARMENVYVSFLGIAAEVCTDGTYRGVRGIWYRTEVKMGTRYTVPSLVVYVPRTEV